MQRRLVSHQAGEQGSTVFLGDFHAVEPLCPLRRPFAFDAYFVVSGGRLRWFSLDATIPARWNYRVAT